MKLLEALESLKEVPAGGTESPVLQVHLVCGFTPLHLQTFLTAHLRREFPEHKINLQTGIFGDLVGNLQRLEQTQHSAVAVVIEWADLDPRLGIRTLGGWGQRQLSDIGGSVRQQAARLSDSLEAIARHNPVTLALPTLPLPPAAFTPGAWLGTFEADLREVVAGMSSRLARLPGVQIVSPQRLEFVSPSPARFEVNSELRFGFPYSLSHADHLAAIMACGIRNPLPKKGLITDLDDTLWMGVLGEDDVGGVFWDLDHHAQKHGLYQQMLASLAEAGTLIGVATKNDSALVEEAFRKAAPIVARSQIFPLESNWGPKSASVSRILEIWNVSAESVVFVDDSPLDLAEVKAAHPAMECLLFPRQSDQEAYRLLEHLRDLFGRWSLSEEDEVRLESIRAGHTAIEVARQQGHSHEDFLREAQGRLTVSFAKNHSDPRALELINKTNQFNLNGKRHTESSWRQYLGNESVFLLLGSYEDKFGPLGKIVVMSGRWEDRKLSLDHWVMSCRAFSRRIEHACLGHLFQKFPAEEVAVDFLPMPRNGPLQGFLREMVGGEPPEGRFFMSKRQFHDHCSRVFLQVQESLDE